MDKNNIFKFIPVALALIFQAVVGTVFTTFLSSYSNPIVISIISAIIILLVFGYYYKGHNDALKEKEDAEQEKEKVETELEQIKCAKNISDNLIAEFKNMGVVDCTHELQDTGFEPTQCMKNVRNHLDFMGIGGAKWVEKSSDREVFERMLQRVSTTSAGKIRFLLLDPEKESYKKLRKLRDNAVPEISYKILKDLEAEYKCLEVRLYDTMPTFRLQFVDHTYVAVSRYYVEREQYNKYQHGWKNPHLIVYEEKDNDYKGDTKQYECSLYGSFELLYNYIWENSREISNLSTEFAYKAENLSDG